MKNPITHFEIYADDPPALAAFYSAMFDWKIEPQQGMDGYILVKTVDVDGKGTPTQPGGINGGIVKRPDKTAPHVLHYVSVASIEGALERARGLGAKVQKPKAAVPGMGWFAILTDPQGGTFALWQTDPNAG
ncbi:MAG TPA: VOC family protein [Polyangia bacterium]|nr:VOC family protein [Polyangia bacterium]